MGGRRNKEFTPETIRKALARQNRYCASCGARIWVLGDRGAMLHKFGERAEAHHVLPVSAGGTAHVDNCVVLCRSCHYSAHQGGRWADNSIYETAMDRSGRPARYVSTATIAKEYPFYKFRKANEVELKSSECRRKIGIDDESHGSTAAKTG